MDTASQQRILGYFIEEAKEHLQTLEQGILQLSAVAQDPERVNEMFRAAHSVKGGAAMLGYNSIQKTAHRLEDSFKVLKENPISVDQKLESLFLAGYDVLHDLIERLESPSGLAKEEANHIIQQAEKNFLQLQSYLTQLKTGKSANNKNAQIAEKTKVGLKHMLQLFKQKPTIENRQKLAKLCQALGNLAPEVNGWQHLTKVAQKAILQPQNSHNVLAPLVIKEIKWAADLMQAGKASQIAPSANLERLAGGSKPAVPTITIPLEPQQAAKLILTNFNQQQVAQLVQILSNQF
ncbi:MAG: histidine kinase [Cyanobacteria bacterium J083]|nr:MAG: histidine kinase [Cyanobacteria bacterium J083]